MSRAMPDKKLYKELYFMYQKVTRCQAKLQLVFLASATTLNKVKMTVERELFWQVPAVVCYGRVVFLPQDLLTSLVPPPPGTVKLVDLTGERRAYLKQVRG